MKTHNLKLDLFPLHDSAHLAVRGKSRFDAAASETRTDVSAGCTICQYHHAVPLLSASGRCCVDGTRIGRVSRVRQLCI